MQHRHFMHSLHELLSLGYHMTGSSISSLAAHLCMPASSRKDLPVAAPAAAAAAIAQSLLLLRCRWARLLLAVLPWLLPSCAPWRPSRQAPSSLLQRPPGAQGCQRQRPCQLLAYQAAGRSRNTRHAVFTTGNVLHVGFPSVRPALPSMAVAASCKEMGQHTGIQKL